MELTLDPVKIRLLQAATNSNYRHDQGHNIIHHVIRLEPDGTGVATNGTLLVVAQAACSPFEGDPLHVLIEKRIPRPTRNARTLVLETQRHAGSLSGIGFIAMGNEMHDARIVPVADTGPLPRIPWYPPYRKVLARIESADLIERADYRIDVKALYDLASSAPDWPKVHHVRFRHLSEHSAVVDLGVPGVTALIALAKVPEGNE